MSSGDRRLRARYALQFPLNYKVLGEDEAIAGIGMTRNLSSSGVAFEVQQTLKPGTYVELEIEWPVPLNGSVPLTLFVLGNVAWYAGGLAAIRMRCCHFRTQRKARARGGFTLV